MQAIDRGIPENPICMRQRQNPVVTKSQVAMGIDSLFCTSCVGLLCVLLVAPDLVGGGRRWRALAAAFAGTSRLHSQRFKSRISPVVNPCCRQLNWGHGQLLPSLRRLPRGSSTVGGSDPSKHSFRTKSTQKRLISGQNV